MERGAICHGFACFIQHWINCAWQYLCVCTIIGAHTVHCIAQVQCAHGMKPICICSLTLSVFDMVALQCVCVCGGHVLVCTVWLHTDCECVCSFVRMCVYSVCGTSRGGLPPLRLPGSSVCWDRVGTSAKFHTPPHSPHMAPSSSPTSSFGYLKSIFLNCAWHFVCWVRSTEPMKAAQTVQI